MSDKEFVLAPQVKTFEVVLSPFWEALNAIFLLHHYDKYAGVNENLIRLANAISPELLEQNRLVVEGFWGVMKPQKHYASYPAFVDSIAGENAVVLRDRAIDGICDLVVKHAKVEGLNIEKPSPELLLGDVDNYIDYMQQLDKHEELTEDIARQAHRLLNDPPAMKALVVDHLRTMWDMVLRDNVEKSLPLLQESVTAFKNVDLNGLSGMEAARMVTGRDLSNTYFADIIESAESIKFVPLSYIAPYVSLFNFEGHSWLLFGARVPEGTKSYSPELSRSELLVRLSALADDTRLRILELLTHGEELFAQDIMNMLELSQSAASRHLRQLSATGYLTERTKQGAKCYRLNTERANDMLHALEVFLLGK